MHQSAEGRMVSAATLHAALSLLAMCCTRCSLHRQGWQRCSMQAEILVLKLCFVGRRRATCRFIEHALREKPCKGARSGREIWGRGLFGGTENGARASKGIWPITER